MSHPVPGTLYRIAAVAGCGSAAALDLGFVVMGVGIAWPAIWLFGRSSAHRHTDDDQRPTRPPQHHRLVP
jgi:hypothetical protein